MGTPWWTTSTSGVNQNSASDFHNTNDNFTIRLVENASGLLFDKNTFCYGRLLEESSRWIDIHYDQLGLSSVQWYLYDSEDVANHSGQAGWELEPGPESDIGSGIQAWRKEFVPAASIVGGQVSGYNQLINLDCMLVNQYTDINTALFRRTASVAKPSGGGFYQRYTGSNNLFDYKEIALEFGGIPYDNMEKFLDSTGGPFEDIQLELGLSIDDNRTGANNAIVDGVNLLRPKDTMILLNRDDADNDVVKIYNFLGPILVMDTGEDNNILGDTNLLCEFHLRRNEANAYAKTNNAICICRPPEAMDPSDSITEGVNDLVVGYPNYIRIFDNSGRQKEEYVLAAGPPMNSLTVLSQQWGNRDVHSIYYLQDGDLKVLRLNKSNLTIAETAIIQIRIVPTDPLVDEFLAGPYDYIERLSDNVLGLKKGSIMYEVPDVGFESDDVGGERPGDINVYTTILQYDFPGNYEKYINLGTHCSPLLRYLNDPVEQIYSAGEFVSVKKSSSPEYGLFGESKFNRTRTQLMLIGGISEAGFANTNINGLQTASVEIEDSTDLSIMSWRFQNFINGTPGTPGYINNSVGFFKLFSTSIINGNTHEGYTDIRTMNRIDLRIFTPLIPGGEIDINNQEVHIYAEIEATENIHPAIKKNADIRFYVYNGAWPPTDTDADFFDTGASLAIEAFTTDIGWRRFIDLGNVLPYIRSDGYVYIVAMHGDESAPPWNSSNDTDLSWIVRYHVYIKGDA